MEIKLNLRLQTLLSFIHFLENLELETAALLVVALLLTPFVFFSLWSLGVAVLCQLFWLGVKAGVLLFVVCSAIMAFMKVSNVTTHLPGNEGQGSKCTLMDIILSVLFQTGLRIPAGIWDRLTSTATAVNGAPKGNTVDRNRKKDVRPKARAGEARVTPPQEFRLASVEEDDNDPFQPIDLYMMEEFTDCNNQAPQLHDNNYMGFCGGPMDLELGGSADNQYQPDLDSDDAAIIRQLVLSTASAATAASSNAEDPFAFPAVTRTRRARGGAGSRKTSRNKK